ncbi:hypothetical protein E2C01_071626 [Portunus trituberculatus]|uniref:Uncharacterized protein n=1 Tax=Portunus trituberculatus TaxID=210409 RepID=A0A5B7I6Q1_PORTR|nr:hypothetical protein [Portunus trituberculatus]
MSGQQELLRLCCVITPLGTRGGRVVVAGVGRGAGWPGVVGRKNCSGQRSYRIASGHDTDTEESNRSSDRLHSHRMLSVLRGTVRLRHHKPREENAWRKKAIPVGVTAGPAGCCEALGGLGTAEAATIRVKRRKERPPTGREKQEGQPSGGTATDSYTEAPARPAVWRNRRCYVCTGGGSRPRRGEARRGGATALQTHPRNPARSLFLCDCMCVREVKQCRVRRPACGSVPVCPCQGAASTGQALCGAWRGAPT